MPSAFKPYPNNVYVNTSLFSINQSVNLIRRQQLHVKSISIITLKFGQKQIFDAADRSGRRGASRHRVVHRRRCQ